MLATRRPVRCVIGAAAPTDLVKPGNTPGAKYVGAIAAYWFGADNLAAWSPVDLVHRIHARVLLINATNDPLISLSQAGEFRAADPRAQTVTLPAGRTPFIHSSVAPGALRNTERTETRFVAASR